MRVLRWTGIGLVALIVLAFAVMWQQLYARHADASPLALSAATSDESVRVEDQRYLTFRPLKAPERMGLVFYPGAYTDIRGYAPTLRKVAEAGYRVVAVPMPFELAILATDRAADAIAANSDIKRWAIAGHSLGGTSASIFTFNNPDAVAGVIIWDSFPPTFASLASSAKPVWQIHRARLDGLPPESFARQRGLFPPDSRWVPIPGGIHMNFGSFTGGGYQEDWAAAISQDAQHRLVVAATLEALADIEQRGRPADK